MLDLVPEAWRDTAGFWFTYLTDGRHLAWYASVQFTIAAALIGGIVALLFGTLAAVARNHGPLPLRWLASGYINIVRGVPDVLFFLFFPIAFEQGIEWLVSLNACTPEALAANTGTWPPCDAANLRMGTLEYLRLGGISLGIVYGAFAGNVIAGALAAVPTGQLDAARAFGLSPMQRFRRIHLRQMWAYALPGLSNCWMTLIKATSLLSLLQIIDIVAWAQRLGAANFSSVSGLVHDDWRWGYFLALLVFYILFTFVSEKLLAALTRWARRGNPMIGSAA